MAINILHKLRVPFIAGRRNFSNVGFVGLGNMGNYMATNLIKKGYKLTVYDINKSAVKNLVAAGATEAASAADLAKNSQVVVTMLPTNDHVWDSFTAKDGLLSSLQKDTLFIDSSTIDPSVSQKVSEETHKHGAKFIDGPVSGGVVGARDATLTFMVGGPKDQYERAKSLLEAMGSRVVHCGDVGMGQVAKLCNNMLLAISMIGVSEVVNLADKLGLDPKVMTSILNTSTGRCWSSEIYPPVPGIISTVPSSNQYQGGFMTSLMTKDLGLAQAAATRSNTPIPLGSLAHQIYRILMTHGSKKQNLGTVERDSSVKKDAAERLSAIILLNNQLSSQRDQTTFFFTRFTMALSSSRVILKIRQQVDVVQKRFRGKINITKPKKLHYTRAVVHEFVTPFYPATRPPTPIWELCENANKKDKALKAPHPYDQILARECLNWYNNSRMIAFLHMNPTKARDELDMRIQLRKSNMYLKYYGKSIYKLALENSRFEAVMPLFCSPARIIFSAEPNVPVLMKILKQNPHMILMAGILDGVLLNIKDFMKYGSMNLDLERAKLVQTIQTAAGANLCRQLNHHPSTFVSRLEAIANKDKDN